MISKKEMRQAFIDTGIKCPFMENLEQGEEQFFDTLGDVTSCKCCLDVFRNSRDDLPLLIGKYGKDPRSNHAYMLLEWRIRNKI